MKCHVVTYFFSDGSRRELHFECEEREFGTSEDREALGRALAPKGAHLVECVGTTHGPDAPTKAAKPRIRVRPSFWEHVKGLFGGL